MRGTWGRLHVLLKDLQAAVETTQHAERYIMAAWSLFKRSGTPRRRRPTRLRLAAFKRWRRPCAPGLRAPALVPWRRGRKGGSADQERRRRQERRRAQSCAHSSPPAGGSESWTALMFHPLVGFSLDGSH